MTALRTFFAGLCVGAADIVPGISGGTVAFIIGVYEELLASIASISLKNIRCIRWQFLMAFIGGVAFSFITLAKGFQYCLQHETLRPLLYSGFMGLVVGSVIFCARLLPAFSLKTVFCIVVGAVSAHFLSGTELTPQGEGLNQNLFWVFICGMMAISAMLLPGISGSYILNIVGMYGPILGALVSFVEGNMAAFPVVASMVLGISFGALVFSHVVRYLLKHYRNIMLAILVGFMVGAMRSVWPFWSVTPHEPILPDFASGLFAGSCAFFALGITAVFVIEYVAKTKSASCTTLSENIKP
jgi:putative membrane protein